VPQLQPMVTAFGLVCAVIAGNTALFLRSTTPSRWFSFTWLGNFALQDSLYHTTSD